MSDAQNNDPIHLYPIAEHTRPDDRHLARAAHRLATAIGKLGQTVSCFDQAPAQPIGRRWIERGDIRDDRLQMRDRFVRPDDIAQISRRRADAAAASPIPRIRSNA